MTLRDYQIEDLNKIRAKYRAGVRLQLVKWSTGTGKTVLFSNVRSWLGLTGRQLVIAHRDELIQQAVDKLRRWNPDVPVGIEKANQHCGDEPIVVSSVQTIGRKGSARLTKFDPAQFDVLTIDEAHRAAAPSYRTVINHFCQNKNLLLLGVTATPSRADGRGLGEVFQEIVTDRDILWGIAKGWLVDLRGIRIKTDVDLNGVHNRAGDFDPQELRGAVNTLARNDLIARSWLEHAKDRPTLIFSVDIQHAKDIAYAFKQYGVPAEAIWGDDPDRVQKIQSLRSGALQVLINAALLVEGFDCWQVSCIGDAAPTQSEGRYVQKIGRGTRIPDHVSNLLEARNAGIPIAKEDCLVLDFVDSTSKHSLVTLATLIGMSKDTNLHGKKISAVAAEVEEVKRRNPLLDLARVEDVEQLQAYAEQVNLFKVAYPPEIIQLSKYKWHRVKDTAYALSLLKRETVVVIRDSRERWHVVGTVGGIRLKEVRPTFEEALRYADEQVYIMGGRTYDCIAKRERQGDNKPPSKAQLAFCQQVHINVPAGATFGEVSAKLTAYAMARREKRLEMERMKVYGA